VFRISRRVHYDIRLVPDHRGTDLTDRRLTSSRAARQSSAPSATPNVFGRWVPRHLTGLHSFYTVPAMARKKASVASSPTTSNGVLIDRATHTLTFTLDNSSQGNEVTGAMFDAMLAELRVEASKPRARVLRIRARGSVFCTGRERAGRTLSAIRLESARIIKFIAALRSSPLITVAEVQGDAFGFGFGLAIVCDFALVADHASLAFPEVRSSLAPVVILSYLSEYALPRFAFPLVLFGEPIDPHRARQIGLISQVCSAERLAAEADTLVERILRLDPSAVRRCKRFFLNAQQNSFDQNCRLAVDALTKGSLALLASKK